MLEERRFSGEGADVAGPESFRESDQDVNGDEENIAHGPKRYHARQSPQDRSIPNTRAMICDFAPYKGS